ncbi:hypothetical protein pb186bvf_012327 [Paramecium bursaria]
MIQLILKIHPKQMLFALNLSFQNLINFSIKLQDNHLIYVVFKKLVS